MKSCCFTILLKDKSLVLFTCGTDEVSFMVAFSYFKKEIFDCLIKPVVFLF